MIQKHRMVIMSNKNQIPDNEKIIKRYYVLHHISSQTK